MKTLYLCRHAKSSWDDSRLTDEERPLTPKGISKTSLVSTWLRDQGVTPDLIISSHAVRAYNTAVIVSKALGYPVKEIRVEPKIYTGLYDKILDIIYSVPNDVRSLMIFGHNPTLSQLANLFLHPGIGEMGTSAVVAISFSTDRWEEVPLSKASRLFFVFPKMLKGHEEEKQS
jgi:phosphohistidine phosphatase